VRAVATMALLFAACGTDDSVVELGRIEFYHDPPVIEAPASAAVGEQFLLRVMSYGGGCISLERTDVELTNEGADFLPFDRRHIPGENEACTLDLRLYPHEATLAFDSTGSKTIRIHGRRVNFQVDEAIQIPLTVVVQ
jgi:hypothetical protein